MFATRAEWCDSLSASVGEPPGSPQKASNDGWSPSIRPWGMIPVGERSVLVYWVSLLVPPPGRLVSSALKCFGVTSWDSIHQGLLEKYLIN